MAILQRFLAVTAVVGLFSIVAAQNNTTQLLAYWGEWGNWSDCSRTCGGGITAQRRECLTLNNETVVNCVGESAKYEMCNIQDCPDDAVDFRTVQCSQYDKKIHKGKYYKWVGFRHDAGECELKCMPKNKFFYVTFQDKVTDGTRCNEHTFDVCVNGTCLPVGCDMQLYSNARIDNCGICNGDNSTCKLIQGEFKLPKSSYGYVDITTIPSGATNIKIRENGVPTNYIALLSNGKSILNGDYIFVHSRTTKHDGSTLIYERTRKNNHLTIDGPIDLSLKLDLYVMKPSDNLITYEYYVPTTYKGVVNKIAEYNWVVEAWSKCSKKCATGKRIRTAYCAKKNTQEKVKDFNCKKEQKPHTEEECNIQACPPRWYISQWSPCSKTCGVGIHTRRVHCVETIKDGNIRMLDFGDCAGSVPITVDQCVVQQNCPQWLEMKWTQCSKTCGEGVQTRKVHCMDTVKENSVEEKQCSIERKPIAKRSCFNAPCGATWEAEKWSECNSQCGSGIRSRTVICRNSEGIEVPAGHCNKNEEPTSFEQCQVLGPCKPTWHATEWSKCTARCGYGMQMRMTVCAVMAPHDKKLTIVNESSCVVEKKPINMRRCLNKKPCHTNYFVSKWSQCSQSCGMGFQIRKVQCYGDREIDYTEKVCKKLQRPTAVRLCKITSCGEVAGVGQLEATTTSTTTTTTTTAASTTTTRREYAARIVSLVGNVLLHEKDNEDYDCIATGDPKPDIKWTLHGDEIKSPRFRTVEINGGSRLVVLAASSEDAGELNCIATNRNGGDSKSLDIKVTGPPVVTISPKFAEKIEGEGLVIRCSADGSPGPRTQWMRDAYNFYGDGNRVIVGKDRITFKRLLVGDTGKYRCLAFNSAGTTEGSSNVVVKRSSDRTTKKECFDDNGQADCQLISTLASLCDIPYYRGVCCASCTKK